MAASPAWKVFNKNGIYMASCREPEAAAAVVSLYGEGATIRKGHAKSTTVWTEGKEVCPAGEGYDVVAITVERRARELPLKLARLMVAGKLEY